MTREAVLRMVTTFEEVHYGSELKGIRAFERRFCDRGLDWWTEYPRQRKMREEVSSFA